MNTQKIISGKTLEEAWTQIRQDLENDPDLFEYNATIEYNGKSVQLSIDIDLGGGFEGGYTLTSFSSKLRNMDDFKFELHRQDIVDGIGKFFGMHDDQIGYPEFDEKMIIHTNHREKLRSVLSEEQVRQVLLSLKGFSLSIENQESDLEGEEDEFLELRIEEGILDADQLLAIYRAFTDILSKLDKDDRSIIDPL